MSGWHGSLTSFTCLIDHRWICKIADYGFQKVKQHSNNGSDESSIWIAPEFLGTETDFGSKKGDVYSFAVICQELLTSQSRPSSEEQNIIEDKPETRAKMLTALNSKLDGKTSSTCKIKNSVTSKNACKYIHVPLIDR